MLTSVKLEFDLELPNTAEEVIEKKVLEALKKIDLTKPFQQAFETEINYMVTDGSEIQELLLPIAKVAVKNLLKANNG